MFDIIMPCYNSAAYVRDAVDSLLSQKYANWRLFAVNDGSTDDTLNILNEYASNDNRIRVFSKENGGYATAINYGLDRISGDYFLVMGSDDRLAPNLFSGIVSEIGDNCPDIIAFRSVKYLNGKNIGLDEITMFDKVIYEPNTDIVKFEKEHPDHSIIFMIRDTAKCYKRSLLGGLRYFGNIGYDADGIFSTLFSHKCSSFSVLPIDGYYWTLRDDSVSAKLSDIKCYDRLCNWIRYYRYISKDSIYQLTKQEKSHIGHLRSVGIKLLQQCKKISCNNFRLIIQAQRCYICGVEHYHLEDMLPKNPLKRIIFTKMPILWCILFRYKTRKSRRMENS